MIRAKIFKSVDYASELPNVVSLEENLSAAVFFLMKLLPARYMIDAALRSGELKEGGHVIETTSGTFGLALAMVCRLRGVRFTMVSDPVAEAPLCRRIRDLGGIVHIVDQPAQEGGYQGARLALLKKILSEDPTAYWPKQYENPRNPGAYSAVAELLASTLGPVDYLVGTVGSGGSMSGTAKALRTIFPSTKAIGVDTFSSCLFGQPDGKRVVRGLGNSLIPPNVSHSAFDEVHWLDPPLIFSATRTLHQNHALYMGPTSGAAYWVARWYARENRGKRVVALMADEGYRYDCTVYNDEWLDEQQYRLTDIPVHPQTVERPCDAAGHWSRLRWNRRSLEEVIGGVR